MLCYTCIAKVSKYIISPVLSTKENITSKKFVNRIQLDAVLEKFECAKVECEQ